jgi:hypothetical protein
MRIGHISAHTVYVRGRWTYEEHSFEKKFKLLWETSCIELTVRRGNEMFYIREI